MFGHEDSREEWVMFGCFRQLSRMSKISGDFEEFINRDPSIEYELTEEELKALEEAVKGDEHPKANGGRRKSSSDSPTSKPRPRKHS